MEEKSVTLSDGQEIILDDDNDIFLSIKSGNEIIHTLEVSYPSGGYGGGKLLLSPSKRYLLFSYFSGESEEAYIIFRICNSHLESVYRSEYICAEGASYIFSQSEEFLFYLLPESAGPWYKEDAKIDQKGNLFFEFCEINILDIGSREISKYKIRVIPSKNWDEDFAEEEPPYLIGITDNFMLRMAMPWGEEKVAFPLDDIIVFQPKEKR